MVDLGALNSATKYPSIETYHELDPSNGSLTDVVAHYTGPVMLTEKVDGTNGRIVVMPDGDWFIGSREELLYARGDRIMNPALGIVEELKPIAGAGLPSVQGYVHVFYLEVYGHRIGQAAKQYTTTGSRGHRLFDIARVPLDVLEWPREKISSWREHGGQKWADEVQLNGYHNQLPLTPRLGVLDGSDLPSTLEETHLFLHEWLTSTHAALDSSGLGGGEGIVLRSVDRSVITKAKFQDYERTLKRRNKR